MAESHIPPSVEQPPSIPDNDPPQHTDKMDENIIALSKLSLEQKDGHEELRLNQRKTKLELELKQTVEQLEQLSKNKEVREGKNYLRMVTLNCNGWREKESDLFLEFKDKNYDVIFLQETKLKTGFGSEVTDYYVLSFLNNREVPDEFEYDWDPKDKITNAKGGTAILFNPKIKVVSKYNRFSRCGGISCFVGELDGLKCTLLNIYAPSDNEKCRPIFFERLLVWCECLHKKYPEYPLVIAGDFNLVLNENLDKFGNVPQNKEKSLNKVKQILKNNNLIDIYGVQNQEDADGKEMKKIWSRDIPMEKKYSYIRASRLDFWLIPENWKNSVKEDEVLIEPSLVSDHSYVTFTVNKEGINELSSADPDIPIVSNSNIEKTIRYLNTIVNCLKTQTLQWLTEPLQNVLRGQIFGGDNLKDTQRNLIETLLETLKQKPSNTGDATLLRERLVDHLLTECIDPSCKTESWCTTYKRYEKFEKNQCDAADIFDIILQFLPRGVQDLFSFWEYKRVECSKCNYIAENTIKQQFYLHLAATNGNDSWTDPTQRERNFKRTQKCPKCKRNTSFNVHIKLEFLRPHPSASSFLCVKIGDFQNRIVSLSEQFKSDDGRNYQLAAAVYPSGEIQNPGHYVCIRRHNNRYKVLNDRSTNPEPKVTFFLPDLKYQGSHANFLMFEASATPFDPLPSDETAAPIQ